MLHARGEGQLGLSSQYGLTADDVLKWGAVTAGGEHIASPESNEDLYWALSGGAGAGGTFPVTMSMTACLHHYGPIGGDYLAFDNTVAYNWERQRIRYVESVAERQGKFQRAVVCIPGGREHGTSCVALCYVPERSELCAGILTVRVPRAEQDIPRRC